MSTTIEITIKGIAIAYRKNQDWHVLFPIDKKECHFAYFTYKKTANATWSTRQPLADAKKPVEISITGTASSATGEDAEFRDDVFDLTSQMTHPKIRMKKTKGKFVVLSIPNAVFSVVDHLKPASGKGLEIEEPSTGTVTRVPSGKSVAHTAKAVITLEEGSSFEIKCDVSGFSFAPVPGVSYELKFDNDCKQKKIGENDMDMFYKIIEEDSDTPGRHFRIGGVGHRGGVIMPKSEPPDLFDGKPCLVVKASDPADLP